jgi:hypothetical protein
VHGLLPLFELRVQVFEAIDQGFKVVDLVQRFMKVAVPQHHLSRSSAPDLLTQGSITLHDTLGLLVQYGDAHHDSEPVEEMLRPHSAQTDQSLVNEGRQFHWPITMQTFCLTNMCIVV